MLAELSKNIASYRKRLKMTQEELARKLNVSFQAVSKWETGQSMPDISLLSDIAVALESDINGLMGYSHTRKKVSYYEEEYVTDSYYWGLAPSHMCYEVMKICPPIRKLRVLDIGCGEGKDAVFFARNGYIVDAFDIAIVGVEKTKYLADEMGVSVNAFQANLLDYRLEHQYDIIFSSGVFHYIPANLRKQLILNYQEHTTPNGIHALNVFVPKPFIEPAPEKEENATVWRSGELATHYSDWLLHEMSESIFDCDSSGIPHQHCMDTVIAQNKT
ncbi:MAG: helix-turn-helix domain-containing protein [Saccharofermentanales bacterium]|jgi:tellurite methyltransferase|nr:helix-turn-helix domain-containing protein [Eubacteriales bacterium]MDD3611255.1 helix-turn-helix domain-containing protein [Eubacteriales bacterium]